MTVQQTTIKNIINHYIYVIDASGSMVYVAKYVVQVMDDLVKFLAEQSKTRDQETRVTVYLFNTRHNIRCVIYDKDVLRTPSIRNLYRPGGLTALIDTVLLAIADAKTIPQKYGDHSFMLTCLTDGKNNDSVGTREQLSKVFRELPDNWTVATFVPDAECEAVAVSYGFPEGNVAIWDAASQEGIVAGASVMQTVSMSYMDNRAAGVRGTRTLFRAKDVTSAEVEKALTPVTEGSFVVYDVGTVTRRVDEFAKEKTGRYDIGRWFYQLTKSEKVQGRKAVVVMTKDGRLYSGPDARRMLGLPDHDQQVSPSRHTDVTVFVQSTAPNRNLLAGTKAVMSR